MPVVANPRLRERSIASSWILNSGRALQGRGRDHRVRLAPPASWSRGVVTVGKVAAKERWISDRAIFPALGFPELATTGDPGVRQSRSRPVGW